MARNESVHAPSFSPGPLATAIASRLEAELHDIAAADGRLPPMQELGRRYAVSKATMQAAVHALAGKGFVRVRRGAPVRLAAAEGAAFPASARRMLTELRTAILDGHIGAGMHLAKIAAYASDYGLSRSTVLDVLRMLEAEGLVHQAGKRRIVGARAPSRTVGRPTHDRTVLIAVPYPGYWRHYLEHYHVAPMFRMLIWELERYGVGVRVVMNRPQPWSGPYVCGFEDVRLLVRELGQRYCGMLVAGDLSGFPQWREWMVEFAKGEPARVHFFLDAAAEAESLRSIAAPRSCYRCSYDERATGAVAARLLAERGHRRVAFMMNTLYAGGAWMRERMEAVRAAGAAGLEVAVFEQNERFWRLADDNSEWVEADPHVFGGYECPRQTLLGRVPSLAAAVADPSVTAIVAPNDNLAVHYYAWLLKTGKVPGRDISLLSFDNNPRALSYPLSTIDLGLRALGYQLAHLFIGDIAANADRDGYLLARPRFVDRGSVAWLNRQ